MTKQNVHPYRSRTLSLLPLKIALTNAGKDLPPRVLKPHMDSNETLALELIERMKADYEKPLPFVDRRVELTRHPFKEKVEANV